jgi:hypothetical protein
MYLGRLLVILDKLYIPCFIAQSTALRNTQFFNVMCSGCCAPFLVRENYYFELSTFGETQNPVHSKPNITGYGPMTDGGSDRTTCFHNPIVVCERYAVRENI